MEQLTLWSVEAPASPSASPAEGGGLEGESGLMWEWCRCVREARPRFVLWENVPGCLSSGPKGTYGEDFRCLLRELDDMRFSVSWRVLDSQFFGVAQRRQRVFLFGASQEALGDAADVCAGLVLLEPGCVPRDRPTVAEAREAVAGAADGGPGGPGRCWSLKVRGGSDTYVKRDGAVGTAGKGALVGEETAFTVAATQDQTIVRLGRADAESMVNDGSVVRRLTPTECERLQGFPDGWTDVPYRGRDHPPDGPRYKAIGNSMTVDVMAWIGNRIQLVDGLMR